MSNETYDLWLGNQASYDRHLTASTRAGDKPEFMADSAEYEQTVTSRIMSVQDGVAILNISGSLTNGSAGYGIYYGEIGYDDIRVALTAALQNPNVAGILLNVDSGGGAVAGAQDLAAFIQRASKVKPMATYTGGYMASAAIWTGAATGYVVASETAIVGSIGVIRVHVDRSEQLKMMGLNVTTIRAGSEKALGSPNEALTDKAKEVMQAQADYIYDIFLSSMADARGVSTTVADTKFGQGREFIGKQALSAGLIDKVGSIEDAFLKVQNLAKVGRAMTGKSKMRAEVSNSDEVKAGVAHTAQTLSDNQPSSQGNPMPKPLTDDQLAAMAAGVTLPEGEVQAETTDAADESAAEVETSAAVAPAVTPDASSAFSAMVEKLQSDLVTARVEANTAAAKLEALTAESAAAFAVVKAAVATLGTHFGVKAETLSAMSSTQLLAEHTRLSSLFTEKFKGGRVAATTTEESRPKVAVNPIFAALTKTHPAK